MGCGQTNCKTCGKPVKKCNTVNGECPLCAGKKK